MEPSGRAAAPRIPPAAGPPSAPQGWGLRVTSQVRTLLWGRTEQRLSQELGHMGLRALCCALPSAAHAQSSQPGWVSAPANFNCKKQVFLHPGYPVGATLWWPFPNAGWVQRCLHRSAACACPKPWVGRVTLMPGVTAPPATPSRQPLGSLQGAFTVPGDACALVPLTAAWSLGSSPHPSSWCLGPLPLHVTICLFQQSIEIP